MSREVTCALCGRPVDDSECVELPNGLTCLDPCYRWLDRMMDEVQEEEDDEEIIFIFEPDEDWDDE